MAMSFAINRVLEWRRWRREPTRRLRDRAAKIRERRPVVVAPSILGTKIVDDCGCVLWGSLKRLYVGPPVATAERAVAVGTLEGFTVVPGVYRYDVFGGLLRYLEHTGGYRRGVDMFVLEYDWRRSVIEGAARLADLVARLRTDGHREVDVVAVSTGGLVVRHFLAGANEAVRRVIYVGTPHRGSFQAISMLHEGVQMVPLGRRFPPAELAAIETCWDGLPHPDDPVFVDEVGSPLPDSLYDAGVWRTVKLGPPTYDLERQLDRSYALHRALDAAPAHADSIVIGARHLPTLSRLPIVRGRAFLPACTPRATDPLAPILFEPGDSSLPARSLAGLPAIAPDRVRMVEPDEHHLLPAHAEVHRLTAEALIEAAP
jgi:pimeloyl-ACP methyl ester carboxylesterase